MKKLLSLILALAVILAAVPASALTVRDFVQLYNEAVGKGFHLYPEAVYMSPAYQTWYLEPDERCQVAVFYEPVDGADPLDYPVTGAAIRHKPRVSVGVFLNKVSSAVAAVFPEVPEEERLAEIMRAMIKGDSVFSYGYFWDAPVPYNTAHMVQFVYEETSEYQTFLFTLGE